MVRISRVVPFWLEEGAPLVGVSGKWLVDFGFDVDTKVVCDVTKGQIIIKVIDCEEQDCGL